MENKNNKKNSLYFPVGFYWGTATSSHQIEGNNKNNDWWRAEQAGEIKQKSGKACDSYNRYEEDFDLAKELGTKAHRFSIEWSRIEPEEGRFDEAEMEHYKKVVKALKERGLEPFVTLHHFTNPIWFADKGGWENARSPYYFARYAEYVAKNLPEVRFWITLNEPMIFGFNAFMEGRWPPFKKSFRSMWHSVYNMTHAHKAAYTKLKAGNSALEIGIAKNNSYFDAYKNKFISRIVAAVFDGIWNVWFLEKIKHEQDFVGINYYFHNRIQFKFSSPKKWMNQNENKEVSDMGWEVYPEGLYKVVKQASHFHKPVYIFENGVADADDNQRSRFIKEHLKWLHKAIEEGVDVRGYFHWSLLDNFEWAEGFKMKFGLVEVDFETLERKPRPSFYVYKKTCNQNALNG
ncbi:MAG: glycoside hydrolase family 1 protein [Candidatus Spechtbacterales bacterium]